MSYTTMIDMSQSGGLIRRLTACAAQEGAPNPEGWAFENRWGFYALMDWSEAWEYAEATKSVNVNPDTGARTDVVTDQMILSAMQAMLAETASLVAPTEPVES